MKKKRANRGRPAKAPKERFSVTLVISVRSDEKIQIEHEAQQEGLPLSTYLRRILSARGNHMAELSEPPKASDDGAVNVRKSNWKHGRRVFAPEERRSSQLRFQVWPGTKIQLMHEAQQVGLRLPFYLRRILLARGKSMAELSEPPNTKLPS